MDIEVCLITLWTDKTIPEAFVSLFCPSCLRGIRLAMLRSQISYRHHRVAPRYAFLASIQLTDVESEKRLDGRTKDLTLFGCFVKTSSPFAQGTKVRVRIFRAGAHVAALGRVVHSRPESGMGISFASIEPGSVPVLDAWLAELRK
jgi:PilZ domain